MANLVTIERGKRSRRGTKTGQAANTAAHNQEAEAQKAKLPYAVAAVVAALLCLYVGRNAYSFLWWRKRAEYCAGAKSGAS